MIALASQNATSVLVAVCAHCRDHGLQLDIGTARLPKRRGKVARSFSHQAGGDEVRVVLFISLDGKRNDFWRSAAGGRER
jgi:hypothetical protein